MSPCMRISSYNFTQKLPTLNGFIFCNCKNHFGRICSNPCHRLHSRITFNECKRSSGSKTVFKPAVSNSKRFFQTFMRFSNNCHIYVESESYIFPHSVLSPGDFYGRCRMVNKVNCKLSFSAQLDCTAHNFNNIESNICTKQNTIPIKRENEVSVRKESYISLDTESK